MSSFFSLELQKMPRTLVAETPDHIGKKVAIEGWVHTKRDHGKITFIDIFDRTGTVQTVGTGAEISNLKTFDVVEIEGLVQKRPPQMINEKILTGEIEIKAEKIEILAHAEEMPFDMNAESLDLELPTLLDFRALTLRHPKVKAVFNVQQIVIDEFRESAKRMDFVEFQSPVIIPQGAEGGAEMFKVKYFDQEAFLAQSPQFYKQILVGVFERVFTVNKTLRAEPSVTTRHLAEVTTLDVEIGFIENWEELMDIAEKLVKDIFKRVEKENKDELKLLNATVPKIEGKIPKIKLRDAQSIIFKRTKRDCRKEPDLAPDDEREISKWSLEEKGSELVFVTHYPTAKRPFYTLPDNNDKTYTLSFDLIGRGVELLTGSMRINDLKTLTQRAKERGIDLKKSELYLQAFRYGMPPEGGFSFGSERLTMQILNLKNIREASLFPRDMERVDVRFSKIKKIKSQ